jgi:hypothetical protein
MKTVIGIFVVLCLTVPGEAFACDRAGPERYSGASARQHIYDSELIFEGVVIGRADENERRSLLGWAEAGKDWAWGPVVFEVTRVWKGQAGREQIVWAPFGPPMGQLCFDFQFEEGQPYLVLATSGLDGSFTSPQGDIVGAIRDEISTGWVEVELANGYGLTWEARPNARREEYYVGLGSYRAVLQQMAEDGVLEPVSLQ